MTNSLDVSNDGRYRVVYWPAEDVHTEDWWEVFDTKRQDSAEWCPTEDEARQYIDRMNEGRA